MSDIDPSLTELFVIEGGEKRYLSEAEAAALPKAPPPDRVLIRKSTVYGRVKALGKVPALLQAFAANPQAAYEWNMPGWPNIYADDPQLLGVLNTIECTAAEIATATAPDPLGPFPDS